MPKRIFIKDGGLTSSVPTPAGYTVIGSDGGIPKKQVQSTISDIDRPYKVYTALLNTQDISNPIVLENTLGSDILWTIGGGGLQYNGAVDNDCFTENKTIGFSYSGGDAEDTYYGFIVQWNGTSEIRIFNTSVDLIHVKIRVEIKVYN